MNYLIAGILFIPLLTALFVSRLDKHENIREAVTLIGASCLFICVLALYLAFEGGQTYHAVLAEPFSGFTIALSLNALGMLFALIASGLWLVTSIYAIGYMRAHHEENQTRFFTLFAVAMATVMAITLADNLFTLFLFYEVLTLSTYPLVTHSGTEKAKKSGRIYLGVLMGSSIGLFLFAILIVWHYTGRIDFAEGGILANALPEHLAMPVYCLFILGIGKAAVMPMHKWLPAAMVAPTPVSALLHAVAVVKAGVFAIIKITVFIFGTDFIAQTQANHIIVWLPAMTILLASLIAMSKDNLKERLAYSTISQLSYIVLGAVLANQMSLIGSSMHIAMHAFGKISLFFAAGAILVTAHKTQVSQLAGLGRKMPITFGVFLIGTLSIIGLPPFGGMWSKWFLALGTLNFNDSTSVQYTLLGVLMISSLLNIAYLLVIPIKGFFAPLPEGENDTIKEAPLPCLVGLVIPAAICIYLFFDPSLFHGLAKQAVGG